MRESKVCLCCRKRISPLHTYVRYENKHDLVDEYGKEIYFCSVACLMNYLGAKIIDPKLEMAPYGECDLWKH